MMTTTTTTTASPRRRRPIRKQGLTFYTTALVVSLFACYSIIRSFSRNDDLQAARWAARDLHSQDLECRLVHKYPDTCAFVKSNCPDEEAGLISYLQFYYCSLPRGQPFAFIVLVIWISLLFSTIGIAASDFLCINLSTIASILGMSESLTGVTFLAFGNGSPDVFSTFAAMSTHSGSLAVGELVGAAGFITTVVAGSMALVKPFQVARRSFIRDVGFFAVAASFSLVFLADGHLRLWECVAMIAFYLFYVVFVVAWHWWLGRRRRRRVAEATARLHHHIPDTQELEAPEIEDDEESRPASERSGLLRGSSGESFPTLLTPGTPAWKIEDVDEDEDNTGRHLAELQSNMRVSRPGRERRNTITPIRPSLIGALEFRAVLSSLEKKSTSQPIGLRRYSEDPTQLLASAGGKLHTASHPQLGSSSLATDPLEQAENSHSARNRAVSVGDVSALKVSTDLLSSSQDSVAVSSEGRAPSEAKHTRASADILRTLNVPGGRPPSPTVVVSPSASQRSDENRVAERSRSPSLLAPPRTSYFLRPDYNDDEHESSRISGPSPARSPRDAPTLQIPHQPHTHAEGRKSPLYHGFPAYTDSPTALSPANSKPPSIRLPAPSMSPESTHHLVLLQDDEREDETWMLKWWPYDYLPPPQLIASTLFPTLYGWRDKSLVDKLLGLVTAPSVFLLSITLPVVEPEAEDEIPDPDPGLLTPAVRSRSHTRATLPPDTPTMPAKQSSADGPPHPHGSGISRRTSDFPKAVANKGDEISNPKEWNRWLVFLQVFTAPLFVVTVVWANMEDDVGIKTYLRLILGSLLFSLISLLALLSLTTPDREPKYRPLLCFLGFAVAIAWISTIANEVVGVLKAFGVILGISDAILGLTIFAVGNSLGDLVADITVARLGYPVMALSACFGGPMLNILLGIGISGVYMTVRGSAHNHKKHPNRPVKYKPYEIKVSATLMISGVTLLVTLIGLLIIVPLNGWRMDRKIGWGLIVLWTLSTIGNVIVELLGYGGELELY